MRTNKGFLFVLLLAISSCDKADKQEHAPTEEKKPAHDDHDEHAELPTRVELSPAVVADAKIRTEPVKKGTLALTVSLPGEVTADPDRSAKIAAPVAGRIEEVRFKEGAVVKKGDAVAVLRVPELGRVRGAQSVALAKAKAARANAERLKSLLQSRLASEQAAVDADAEAKSLSIEAQALGEQLAAMGASGGGAPFLLTLRAPLDGIVIGRDAVVGQPVTAEQTLGSIADLREVWFLGRVFEKDLGRLRMGAGAEVQLNAYPAERFQGMVDYVGQRIDPIGRTVTARIRLVNRQEMLRIGLFGTAYVETGGASVREPRLLVPRSALTDIGPNTVVFVKHADGDFELHKIVLGDAALGRVEVVSGLREGEEVVVEGVFTLKSAVLKSTLAEDE